MVGFVSRQSYASLDTKLPNVLYIGLCYDEIWSKACSKNGWLVVAVANKQISNYETHILMFTERILKRIVDYKVPYNNNYDILCV